MIRRSLHYCLMTALNIANIFSKVLSEIIHVFPIGFCHYRYGGVTQQLSYQSLLHSVLFQFIMKFSFSFYFLCSYLFCLSCLFTCLFNNTTCVCNSMFFYVASRTQIEKGVYCCLTHCGHFRHNFPEMPVSSFSLSLVLLGVAMY